MPRRIGCGERDHLTRFNQPGWEEYLAVRNDLPGSVNDPVVPSDGYLCAPCALVEKLRRQTDLATTDANLSSSRAKFAGLGFTPEEIDNIVPKSAQAAIVASLVVPDDASIMAAGYAAAAAVSRNRKS